MADLPGFEGELIYVDSPYTGWEKHEGIGGQRPCPECGTLPEKDYSRGEFLRWFYPNCLTYDSERGAYYYECQLRLKSVKEHNGDQ